MNLAFLLIGGNQGNRKENLEKARKAIEQQCGRLVQCSALFETAAWGLEDQPSFLNQALAVQTSLAAPELLQQLLGIEESLGRVRQQRYGPRTIDLDILFFNSDVINTPSLQVPHPQIQNRRFALQSLADIAPDFMHPVFHKTISELLSLCPDRLEVKRL